MSATRRPDPHDPVEALRKAAKRWLRALRAGDGEALARLRRALPDAEAPPTLRTVQHALARERGFAGWRELKASPAGGTSTEARLTALLEAAAAGDARGVAAILDAAPELLDRHGTLPGHTGRRTALHFGVHHEAVVRELLARGADPNLRDEGDDACPLHFAAERGDLAVVRLLVEHGADPVGAGTMHELDAAGWAVGFEYAHHPEVARYLFEHGAPPTVVTAVALGDVGALRALARAGADLDRRMDRTNHRRTPLHLAVVKRQPEALAALLELGADPDLEDAAGLTPLDEAALAGDRAVADRLLGAGARMRLPAAILLDRTAELDRLLAEDPDLRLDDRRWARLLVRASARGSGGAVERLVTTAKRLRAGLTIVDLEDDPETAVDGAGGFRPLHAAAGAGNLEAIEVLLRHGASPRARDRKYGATPAGWARWFGHASAHERLLAAGVDLFDAVDADRGDVVARILDGDPDAIDRPFGAYADASGREGAGGPAPDCRPLAWAEAQGREEARRVLLERGAARRTLADAERAEAVLRFLRAASWDHHVHGRREHRSRDLAARRLLARDPWIARASLHAAVVAGEIEEVRRILAERPGAVRARGGGRDWTPLLALCYARLGHPPTQANAVAIARLLLDAGADPNDSYPAGGAVYTALVGAAAEGEQDAPRQPYAEALFDLLLERGAEPFDVQVLYDTHFSGEMLWWLRLVHARTAGTPRGAAWSDPSWPMFDMGAYGSGARFVLETALRRRRLELARWALEHGADPDPAPARDPRFPKTTLRQEALLQGFPELAELLARHGAPDAPRALPDRERLVPASLALDREEIVRLLERQPDLRADPAPLFAAAEQDRAEAAALLLDLGWSPDVADENDERPLHRAAAADAAAVLELLLARGAEVDPRERRYGATPLGWASHGDRTRAIELLAPRSRDLTVLCYTGRVDRVRELLGEEPGLARRVDPDGTTPLWWQPDDEEAALAVTEALLGAGADPAARSVEGRTAADAARRRGLFVLAARLEAAPA